jgi:hypothetical protein
MENITQILHFNKKSSPMKATEKFYIYKEAVNDKQLKIDYFQAILVGEDRMT